jgi:hypothetical protein
MSAAPRSLRSRRLIFAALYRICRDDVLDVPASLATL